MAENEGIIQLIEPNRIPPKLSRRNALRLGALLTGSILASFFMGRGAGDLAADSVFGLANAEPKFAMGLLTVDNTKNRFTPKSYPVFQTPGEALRYFKERITAEEQRTNSSLVGAQVMIYDRDGSKAYQITYGNVLPSVAIASVAKYQFVS